MSALKTDENPQTDIRDVFVSCVDSDVFMKTPIIETIPEDFVDLMRDFLEDEKKLYKKYNHKKEMPENDYEGVVAGRLFEFLCYQEYSMDILRGLHVGTPERKRAEDTLFVSSILCKIARHPAEYGLPVDEHSRIPDGVYIKITQEGTFYVYGLAEAKLGALDSRAIDQIKYTGSRTTMARVIEQVQGIIDKTSVENTQPEIADLAKVLAGRRLKVRWDKGKDGKDIPRMSLDILVPTRRDYFSSGVLVEKSVESDFNAIKERERIRSKPSFFNATEVFNMAKAVMERM